MLPFERKCFLISYGIPFIAGMPLASSLEYIHSNNPCLWMELLDDGFEERLEISLVDRKVKFAYAKEVGLTEILELIEGAAVFPGMLLSIKLKK